MSNSFPFDCEKQPAAGSRGVVVSNHPAATAVGAQILLEGGNAIDAAVATLFALTVVEPMMVGVLGGGICHLRTADGRHRIIDGLSTAPLAARPDLYRCLGDEARPEALNYRDTEAQANEIGALAVAVPGALAGWCHAAGEYGTLPLADLLAPAIRLASEGFRVTPYLQTCVSENAQRLARDPDLAALLLPGGKPVEPGTRLFRADYAATLSTFARDGADALYRGEIGRAMAQALASRGGIVSVADLAGYAVREREVIRASYRGFEIVGAPPPSSSGVHIAQMLNLLEGWDIGALGFGTADTIHLLAEAMKIAFADRAFATADPDFIDVPVDRLVSKSYAVERRTLLDEHRARHWTSGLHGAGSATGRASNRGTGRNESLDTGRESADTTHVSVADALGNIVCTTQTINGLFGACMAIPGTGLIANNYMLNFDPHPGHALSIAPGKRVFTSMAPMIVLQHGKPRYALGLPGGLRIFPSALQAIINLIDHRMSLQQAVEAPRIWTQGDWLELEAGFERMPGAAALLDALGKMGHRTQVVPRIAGGMNAIGFEPGGMMLGAACWRADGTPVGIGGGLARAGTGFSIA